HPLADVFDFRLAALSLSLGWRRTLTICHLQLAIPHSFLYSLLSPFGAPRGARVVVGLGRGLRAGGRRLFVDQRYDLLQQELLNKCEKPWMVALLRLHDHSAHLDQALKLSRRELIRALECNRNFSRPDDFVNCGVM